MWVWDSSQQVLATQGAVYVQGHCLQEQRLYKQLHCLQALGPLQEHTTFRESLVCYTSPPGEVYESRKKTAVPYHQTRARLRSALLHCGRLFLQAHSSGPTDFL